MTFLVYQCIVYGTEPFLTYLAYTHEFMIQSIKSSNFKQASADQKTMQQVLQGLFAQTTNSFHL